MPTLEKYPSYKNSGVEWLGDIPEYWKVKKIKHLFNIGRGRVISQQELDEEGTFPVYSSQTKNNGILGYIKTFDYDCKQITWTTDGANAGTVFLREGKHNCTNVCGTLQKRNEEENLEFINFSLQVSAQFYKRPDTNGAKIMNNEMAEIVITYPPKEEQIKIASFLDEKTAQIDEVISQKEKLIELLKERKQIVINDAVTKGLDKDVEFVDSGVEWIGKIPKHWEISKVKNIFKLIIEPAPKANEEELLSIYTDIGVRPRKELAEKGNKASTTDGYWRVKKGDFIVNKLLAWMGAIGLSEYEGVTSPAYDILRAKKDIVGIYYHELFRLKVFSQEMKKYSRGIMDMRLRLYFDKFGDILIPYPSYDEQLQIVEYIENQTTKIDKAIELQQNYILRLKEYKASLIDSVVTGKVRVA